MGIRSSTKDECGRTFAPQSPKRGSPSKKKGVVYYAKGLKAGKEGSRGGGMASRAIFVKVLYVFVSLHMCARI